LHDSNGRSKKSMTDHPEYGPSIRQWYEKTGKLDEQRGGCDAVVVMPLCSLLVGGFHRSEFWWNNGLLGEGPIQI
jgi:hypothetical protein